MSDYSQVRFYRKGHVVDCDTIGLLRLAIPQDGWFSVETGRSLGTASIINWPGAMCICGQCGKGPGADYTLRPWQQRLREWVWLKAHRLNCAPG